MKRRLICGVAAAALLCVSSVADADAAVVSVRPLPAAYSDQVTFIAAPGEVNSVVLHYTSDEPELINGNGSWTVIDTDSVLVAGESCQAIDLHAVRCRQRPNGFGQIYLARVDLGDLDDRLTVEGNSDQVTYADGGAGRDRLLATDGGNIFNGGPGDDQLTALGSGGDGLFGDILKSSSSAWRQARRTRAGDDDPSLRE